MIFISYIILFLIILFVVFYIITYITGGWYAPLSQNQVKEMLNTAHISKRDYLIDLGSGDGRVLIEAGKRGTKSLGFEINPFLFWISKLLIAKNHLHKLAKVEFANFWYQDLSKATVITIFLAPLSRSLLEKKLLKELKPGSRVITYGLAFQNWKITKQTTNGIFLYIKD